MSGINPEAGGTQMNKIRPQPQSPAHTVVEGSMNRVTGALGVPAEVCMECSGGPKREVTSCMSIGNLIGNDSLKKMTFELYCEIQPMGELGRASE